MALTPEQIERLSEPVRQVYRHLEDELITNIAKRFNTDKGLATTHWQIKKPTEIGKLTQDNIKTIAKYVAQVPGLTQIALEGAAWEILKDLEPKFADVVKRGYLAPAKHAPTASPSIINILENYQKQALIDFNLVNTTMLDSSLTAYRQLVQNTVTAANYAEAQGILNKAAGEVITGIASRQTALTNAIKQMAQAGITGFYDKAGRKWTPEAYVNMDIRTTFNNVATQATFSRMDDYGVELIEITSYSGARPKCAIDQGKIYNKSGGSGYTTDGNGNKIAYHSWRNTTYGEPDGILGINCGHSAYPFFAGLSYKRSEPTKDFAENDRLYKQSQQQRQYERDIKMAKRDAIAQKAAGNTEAFENASIKVKQSQTRLDNFIASTGRTIRPDRVQVVGYDRSIAASARAVTNYKSLIGTKAINGVTVTQLSKHLVNDRLFDKTRLAPVSAFREALTKPLKQSTIKIDNLGRPSQQLIGERITVVINTNDGTIASFWRTSSALVKKLKGGTI